MNKLDKNKYVLFILTVVSLITIPISLTVVMSIDYNDIIDIITSYLTIPLTIYVNYNALSLIKSYKKSQKKEKENN